MFVKENPDRKKYIYIYIFPTDKDMNIHLATIIIRAIFAKDGKYYPQLFLDDGLYKNVSDERIDISDGIDVNKSDESKECTLCHYWYFLDKSFSYGPYLCGGCYNMMQKCNKLKNIAIVHIKESVYRICFLYMSNREVKKLLIDLIDKKGILQKICLFFFII